MPTITRVVGLANQNPESNTDKVWAGVLLERDDGLYQFVSLYGRRGAALRPAYQEPGREIGRGSPRDQFERARRDKLAHGYSAVDWTQARYGMLAAVRNLGTFSAAVREQYESALGERLPNQFREDNDTERRGLAQSIDRLQRQQEIRERAAARQQPQAADRQRQVEADAERDREAAYEQERAQRPSVDDLRRYIDQKTGQAPQPEPEPAPTPEAPKWIRKARRQF